MRASELEGSQWAAVAGDRGHGEDGGRALSGGSTGNGEATRLRPLEIADMDESN